MKFGLFNLMTLREGCAGPEELVKDTLDMVRLAEEIGFDIAWFAEHHFSSYSICPSPLMMAAHVAGMTSRIRLGAAVVVLPLHNPVRMVQEIGLLDVVSGGRAVIGIGSGYQGYEFKRFGRELAERNEVSFEVWDIMEQALTTGEIGYEGHYFQIPNSPVAIRPLQKPLPEIFVTGLAPEILQRAAVSGYTPFITGGWKGLEATRVQRKVIVEQFEAASISADPLPLGVQQYVHVTDDKAEAMDMAERSRFSARIVHQMRTGDPALDGPYIQAPPMPDEPPLETFRDNLAIGDPETCAERVIADIRELQPTHYSCFMQIGGLPGRRALRALERFGAEVIPLIEKELGPIAELTPSAPSPTAVPAE